MGANTTIAWTDATFNPWWGCERVSPGCDNCYAETFSHRLGLDLWGHGSGFRFFGDKHWNEPVRWNRKAAESAGEAFRVFCASMADVFQLDSRLTGERARLFRLIEETPSLTWQLLTKRPENVARLAGSWMNAWPENVWLGTTVEDQARADLRVPRLLDIPAAIPVRFLSCEPLLGPVTLRSEWTELELQAFGNCRVATFTRVDWIICGGESGPKRRPFDYEWARRLRQTSEAEGIPFFFKQDAGLRSGEPGPPDLAAYKDFPRG